MAYQKNFNLHTLCSYLQKSLLALVYKSYLFLKRHYFINLYSNLPAYYCSLDRKMKRKIPFSNMTCSKKSSVQFKLDSIILWLQLLYFYHNDPTHCKNNWKGKKEQIFLLSRKNLHSSIYVTANKVTDTKSSFNVPCNISSLTWAAHTILPQTTAICKMKY